MISRRAVWIEPEQYDLPAELVEFTGGNYFLAGELIRRGINSVDNAKAFIEPANYTVSSPYELQDMDIAVDLLARSINQSDLIGIWGDFDVDGQTSTAILVEGLQKLGGRIKYHIPVRGPESHGINLDVLKEFLGDEVRVLLTCDTGISAHQSISYAKSKGVKVVITDHHSLPDTLPNSDANVNPRRLALGHPLAHLSGAGTAYKLIEALYHLFKRAAESDQFLDLVALGTIADVAELIGENRYLVQKGLAQIRNGKRPAIRSMAESAGIMLDSFNEEHVSYALAPRLNAIGRLGDANPIVSFLLSIDSQEINVMTSHLEGLNIHRRMVVDQVIKSALFQIEANPGLLKQPVLILDNPNWPGGVIGIAASKLVELYHLPTILLTTKGGEIARGSARSIDGIDISRALKEQHDLLDSYGGHPMAAGLSLSPSKIPDFRNGLAHSIEKMTTGVDLTPRLLIHGYRDLGDINLDISDALELLAPFGAGNPPPVLVAPDMTVISRTPVGRNEDHSQLILKDKQGEEYKVIWWQSSALTAPEGLFDLAYTVRKSDYRGQQELQIQWVDYRQTDDSDFGHAFQKSSLELIDLRSIEDTETQIQGLLDKKGALVWAERVQPFPFPTVNRLNLIRCEHLVLASIPPSISVLREILSKTRPKTLHIADIDPGNDSMQIFLEQLSGLVLYSINQRSGYLQYNELAARLCHSDATVQAGTNWLVSNGIIQIINEKGDSLQVSRNGSRDQNNINIASKKLRGMLDETRSFRNYYKKAEHTLWISILQELDD